MQNEEPITPRHEPAAGPETAPAAAAAGSAAAADPLVIKHGRLEDALGVITGAIVISLGLFLLRSGGVVSGGTAGLSLLLSYTIAVPFGLIFIAVNLPFFALAARGKGLDFVLRSGFAIVAVSALTSLHAQPWAFGQLHLHPAYAALFGNVLCGVGLLILFRHNSSLGGFNIIALFMQERFGIRAGYVLMVLDGIVVLCSAFVTPFVTVAISAAGVVIVSVILAQNHRPGRYLGG